MLYRISATPCHIRRPAPLFGEHNRYVLRELLGLSDEAMAQLTKAGIRRVDFGAMLAFAGAASTYSGN